MSTPLSNELLKKYHDIFVQANNNEAIRKHIQHEKGENELLELNFATPLRFGESLPKKKVLFVGINPSYRRVDAGKQNYHASSLGNGSNDYFPFPFALNDHGHDDPYFRKIHTLIQDANIDINECGYLDVFVHRRTAQNSIKEILKSDAGINFLCAQLTVFHRIVFEMVKPTLIVVLNARAQEFLGLRTFLDGAQLKQIWLGYQTNVGDILGTKKITDVKPELRTFTEDVNAVPFTPGIQVIPSQILTYMSKEDRENLVWTLNTFARLHGILLANEQDPKNEAKRLEALLQAIKELKTEALKSEDYHELAKLRNQELEINKGISKLIDIYSSKLP